MNNKGSNNNQSNIEVVNKNASTNDAIESLLKQKAVKALKEMDQLEKEIEEIENQEDK